MSPIYTIIAEREYDGLSHGEADMLKNEAIAYLKSELNDGVTAIENGGSTVIHLHILIRKGTRSQKE